MICNGTSVSVAQPSNWYDRPGDLCGFASCIPPSSSSLSACCSGSVQSLGLFRFCEPRNNDTNDWAELGDDYTTCLQMSDVDFSGSWGVGCNRNPNGAGKPVLSSAGSVWMIAGLVALLLR